jgi:hypothetical protein
MCGFSKLHGDSGENYVVYQWFQQKKEHYEIKVEHAS